MENKRALLARGLIHLIVFKRQTRIQRTRLDVGQNIVADDFFRA